MRFNRELTDKILSQAETVGPSVNLPAPEREAVGFLDLTLPLPPSDNNLFATVRRGNKMVRVKTKAYREWQASLSLPAVTVPCPVRIHIYVRGEVSERFDLGNLEKGAVDSIVAAGIIPDDSRRYVKQLCVTDTAGPGVPSLRVVVSRVDSIPSGEV